MKKFIGLIFCAFLFFSCNMDIALPTASQKSGDTLQIVLGSTQARSITEGYEIAQLDKAEAVRVRFFTDKGEEIVRMAQVTSKNTLTVSGVPSGFYTSVEVDIMDKLNTYTAAANGVTLSAEGPNDLRVGMERVTPHLVVQDNRNKFFYTFPDLDDLSLCFAVKTDEPNMLLSGGFTQTFFDKWGCFFGRLQMSIPMLVPSAYSNSSLVRTCDISYKGMGGLIYYDRTANKLYEYEAFNSNSSPFVQTVTWTGAADKVNISGNFNDTKAIAANGNTLYRVRAENNDVYVDKFTLSFKPSPAAGIGQGTAEHKEAREIITFEELDNALLDIAGGKLFVFAKSGKPTVDGPGTLFVLDAENLSVITSVQLTSKEAVILKMLGVRGSKVYFAVDDADTTIQGALTSQDYVGVYDLDKKTFSKADSAKILAAAQNALGTAQITPKIDYQ